jgi:hypothetical protein
MVLLLSCTGCKKEEQNIKYKIKKAELGTVEYTVRQIIRNSDESWKFFGDRKVLFSVKATLKAGIDLDKLSDEDIEVRGSQIKITLPQPEIVALNIKPDDIKLAYSKVSALRTEYSQKEIDEILTAGERSIREDESLRSSIVDDAKANAREFFEILLRASGYNDIEVAFEDE